MNTSLASQLSKEAANESSSVADSTKKRARPVLSCIECRRKKLKCDRVLPCIQCTKLGRSSECTYSRNTSTKHAVPNDSESENEGNVRKVARQRLRSSSAEHQSSQAPELGTWLRRDRVDNLQDRVEKLEQYVQSQSLCSTGSHVGAENHATSSRSASNRGVLVSKALRSRYHGPDQKLSLLYKFEGAEQCIRGLFSDSSLLPLMKQYHMLRKTKGKPAANTTPSGLSILSRMLQDLPPQSTCDRLVGIYFNTFEKLLRILHLPTFLRDCQNFWATRDLSPESFADVVPQLFAISAITSRLGFISPSLETIPAEEMCELVELWLSSLGGKQHRQLSVLRTRCLLLIAQQLNDAQIEKMWISSGNLVRSAITMGLHRDPTEFPELSIFEGEQRRKLWMTIAELDLQLSLAAGFDTSLRADSFNTQPPTNLDDDALSEGMTDMPLGKSMDKQTDSRFQILLARCLPERLRALAAVEGVSSSLPKYEDVLSHGFTLEQTLQSLPQVSELPLSNPASHLDSILLDIYVRRALLRVYRSHALESLEKGEFVEAREACTRLSVGMLSHGYNLDMNSNTQLTNGASRQDSLYHKLCKTDVIQAATTICLELRRLSLPNTSATFAIAHYPPSILFNTVSTTLHAIQYKPTYNPLDILVLTIIRTSVAPFIEHLDDGAERSEQMRKAAVDHLKGSISTQTHDENENEVHHPPPPVQASDAELQTMSDIAMHAQPEEVWMDGVGFSDGMDDWALWDWDWEQSCL